MLFGFGRKKQKSVVFSEGAARAIYLADKIMEGEKGGNLPKVIENLGKEILRSSRGGSTLERVRVIEWKIDLYFKFKALLADPRVERELVAYFSR